MGKKWDKAIPSVKIWSEVLRVMKPGAFAAILCTPRQDCQARMIINLEDAGFVTGFTSIMWTYATGFPKAANLSKLADKRAGAEREIIDRLIGAKNNAENSHATSFTRGSCGYKESFDVTAPSTPEAKALDGAYAGFQPKPAFEPVLIVMKPLSEKTYLDQALANGKGCTWLDGARIPTGNLTGTLPCDIVPTCLQNHTKSNVNNAGRSKSLDGEASETRPPCFVLESAALRGSEKTHGKTRGDTSRMDMSCSGETLTESTSTNSSTDTSGSLPMVNCHQDTLSTTSTGTSKTTDLKTLNVSREKTTPGSTTKDTGLAQGQIAAPGRFPANLLCCDDALNDGRVRTSGAMGGDGYKESMWCGGKPTGGHGLGDSGSYSRYFDLDAWFSSRIAELPEEVQRVFPWLIVPKPSKREKNAGLEGMPEKERSGINKMMGSVDNSMKTGSGNDRKNKYQNHHPTVKPVKLMSYLITLFSQPGDIVLDPFVGSGTTKVAADIMGRNIIGVELDPEFCQIASAREPMDKQKTLL